MKKQKNVYFSHFGNYPKTSQNLQKFSLHKNAKLIFDKNSLEIISYKGDRFNLKFKNTIEDVLVISDGIIIKFIQSNENLEFFHNSNKTQDKNNFLYYLITNHPLKNISQINTIDNESIMNLNIIKSTSRFPFLVSKNLENKFNFYLMLNKEQKGQQDFNNYLNKMIYNNSDSFLVNENLTNFESNYFLLFLTDFQVELDFNLEEIKIYTSYFEKKSVYFSFFDKNKFKLYIVELKFKKNDFYNFEKKFYVYNNVAKYELVDSIFNIENTEELFENKKRNKINNNLILKYLSKKFNFGVKEKTLYYLDKNGVWNYLEGSNIILKMNQEKKLKFRDEILLNLLKYFKKHLFSSSGKEKKNNLFYLFLKNFLLFFSENSENDDNNKYNVSIIFLDFLIFLFAKIYHFNFTENKNNDKFNLNENVFNIVEELEDLFPLLYEIITNDSNYQNSQNNLFLNKGEKFILPNLNSEIFNYFNLHKEDIINLLSHFCIIYYEYLSIQNYYENSKNNLLNFVIKILQLSNKNNLLYKYIKAIVENYGIPKNINSQLLNKNNLISQIFYKNSPNHQTFIEYLKNPILSNNNLQSNNNFEMFHSTYFNLMKNLTIIFNLLTENNSTKSNEFLKLTTYKELQINQEYNLFKRKLQEEKIIPINNSICAIIKSELDINKIKMMHPLIQNILLNSICKNKINPYKILTSDNTINTKISKLLDRLDIEKNFTNQIDTNNENLSEEENIEGLLYENQSSNYESDYYITNIKFNEDTRFKEVLRICNPNRNLRVNTNNLNEISDSSKLELEKFNLMFKNLLRQFSSTIGYGAINLNTIKNFPKNILNIKNLNMNCILSDWSNFKLDVNSELVKDKEFIRWPEFHNGVSHALKLSAEFFNNKSFIRNWILFNKQNSATYEHAGFLFGLGLLKQLDSLYSTDVFQYMKCAHDGITIGMLLGRAASQISTMEESLSRTLCVHIMYLIPQTLELIIPINIQCAAIIGLGLLYLGTGNILMTEMLSNQIGRKFTGDKNMNISHIESYNLCLGFSIGLINLGIGKINSNDDLKLEETLLNFANGGKKIEINKNNNFNRHTDTTNNNNFLRNNLSNLFPVKKTNLTFAEEYDINSFLTGPTAYSCLSLIYLQSNNIKVANKIKIPKNLYELDSFKPFHLYLAILTRNLILFDNINSNNEFVMKNVPEYIKFLYENKFATISDEIEYSNKLNNINFSQISTSYYFSIAAGLMSLGFKYAGSNDKEVAVIIIDYINKFRKVKVVNDIIILNQTKFNDTNKFYLNKNSLEQILCISAYALALVMAGSGDLDSFKLLRILRKKLEGDIKTFNYGYNQAIHHAIGMLFLGAGTLTFSNDKQSLAFLYISTFPVFADNTNCNEKYLQPLRHLYILSCENKILETRDIDSNLVIRSQIELNLLDDSKIILTTPANVDDFSQIKMIKLLSNDHYYLQFEMNDIFIKFRQDNFINKMRTKCIYIKRRVDYGEKIFDVMKFSNSICKFHNNFDFVLIKNLIEELKISVRNFIHKMKISKPNLNLEIISKNILDLIQSLDMSDDENFINKYSLLIQKNSLLLLIEYMRNDKLNIFFVVNDYLMKLLKTLADGLLDFKIFGHFFDLGNMRIEDSNEKMIYEEIRQIITDYVKLHMKEIIKTFFTDYKNTCNNNSLENFNSSMDNILNVVSFFNLFKINFNVLDKNEGKLFLLLSNLSSYVNQNNIKPEEMKTMIKNIFAIENLTQNNLKQLDSEFQNYLIDSIYSMSPNEYEIVIYLIELFLDILNN